MFELNQVRLGPSVCIHTFMCAYVSAYVCACVYECMAVGLLLTTHMNDLLNKLFYLNSLMC